MNGKRTSFYGLIQTQEKVKIPLIQRDYAQGRETASEVRTLFLQSIHQALTTESPALDLDFVYGSQDNEKAFCPLDGQQRLTTLLLLHWYLACHEGQYADFSSRMRHEGRSRFTYAVRPSSTDFFDALVAFNPGPMPGSKKLTEIITDQSWFFNAWHYDLTIKGALTMLDTIHAHFHDSKNAYCRLSNITFQLLNLDRFNLSDDLYIKMNARGKPLTVFETFKARLEEKIGELFQNDTLLPDGSQGSLKQHFSNRIDKKWTDLFWNYRDPETLFDDKVMRLVRAVAIITRPTGDARWEERVKALNQDETSLTSSLFIESADKLFIITLTVLLDRWCGLSSKFQSWLPEKHPFDEKAFFETLLNNAKPLEYAELVRLSAYAAYHVNHTLPNKIDPEAFGEWMRIIHNLAVNTRYTLDYFNRSQRSIASLIKEADNIVEHFASSLEVGGFDTQQIREEQLKAQLLKRNDSWWPVLHEAERHPFFDGQIEFLLKFSGILDTYLPDKQTAWSHTEDKAFQNSFHFYFQRARHVFPTKDKISDKEYRLERALIAKGDFEMPDRSFHLIHYRASDTHRWKRLLQGGYEDLEIELQRESLRSVLKFINLDNAVAASLQAIIDDAVSSPQSIKQEWRYLIVKWPQTIAACGDFIIRPGPGTASLLEGRDGRSKHFELYSYVLYLDLLSEKHKKGKLTPFSNPGYHPTRSETPCAYLNWKLSDRCIIALDITFQNHAFGLSLFQRHSQTMRKDVSDAFQTIGFAPDENNRLHRQVMRGAIESAIDDIVRTARNHRDTHSPS
ncbi:uncharacterized protein DUF262 [Prosthecobacter fusiformis]|uniref:Uncharacterized protein DUF262 n=1 Tax=Prosthecobacter fusiformis TaxID=48464 RepID=A0A4R7RSY1_9BACT|nr:DUF262 domain-containing protein [Prosthecobacter fusiformis]TDU68068.1 uncharacterized protein DUF262 [Prosthecobacter fusiformis]